MSSLKNICLGASILAILLIFVLVLFHHTIDSSESSKLHESPKHIHHHDAAGIFDPAIALANLKVSVMTSPELMVSCHMETHMIGNRAYSELGSEAYAYINPICGGGYLHGVVEQSFRENGVGYAEQVVHEVCTGEITESCLHGVGHGLHEVLGSIDAAIDACASITQLESDCFDGVFMDAFDMEGMTDAPLMDIKTALRECENTLDAARQSCYFYLPRILTHGTAEEITSLCNNEAAAGWGACAQGSGVYFMKSVSGFVRETAVSYCNVYDDTNMESLCIAGVTAYELYGSAENTKWH